MKIAILGCGVMGSAFARQLAKGKHELYLCDHSPDKGRALAEELGARFFEDLSDAAQGSEIILLAIKPKDVEEIARGLKGLKGKILMSILAGVSVSKLQSLFKGCQIVRSCPIWR